MTILIGRNDVHSRGNPDDEVISRVAGTFLSELRGKTRKLSLYGVRMREYGDD